MYDSFYGFKENPFNLTPDPQFIYLGENHREALAQLVYGVREKKGFIVLTGEVGTGKTTIIRCFLQTLNGNNNTRAAFLFNPKLSVNDFIQYILRDLGLTIQGTTKGDYLYTLYEYLINAYQNEEKVVLIVDEAQGLNPALLEEIRLLSNLETSKSKLIQIVLVGQPELNKTLSQMNFRQIRQRINLRHHLQPLSEKETGEYIRKRLKIAGRKQPLFTDKAVKEVYRKTKGIPRLINVLCDNSLLTGYALDKKIINEKIVKAAAKDLKLGKKPPASWKWIIPGILIIVGFISFFFIQGEIGPFLTLLQSLKEIIPSGIQNFFK
ncbi:MAG: AAA family ATPase [Deltaproteobacteria bacterium]|nr:AAA family ATPase [Deltaproteobacteria bacterium]